MPSPTLLDDEAAAALLEAGPADVVVGIPSFNTERTIAHVVKAAQYGLAKFFPSRRALILVSDGGSGDGTRERAAQAGVQSPDFDTMLIAKPAQDTRVVVGRYKGPGGKGSAIRAVLEASHLLGAKATLMVDADLRSISPSWMELLAGPVLLKGYDFVAPEYARHKYDGTITNMMVYPLTRALYGHRIRQPIGGDFGMGPAVVERAVRADAWATDVARFGIDIWLTTLAVTSDARICQANLGAKTHDAKDPRLHLAPMAVQVMGTVFRLAGEHAKAWHGVHGSQPVRAFGFRSEVAPAPVSVEAAPLIEAFRAGLATHRDRWAAVLGPETLRVLDAAARLPPGEFRIPADAWARLLYEVAAAHRSLALGDPAAAAWLVDSLVPLYLGRTASFVQETRDLSTLEAESVVEAQAEVFEAEKPHLLARWRELGLPA